MAHKVANKRDKMESISIKNLHFGYDKKSMILNDISLSVREGEFVGILGANGSGKSTLIKNILGFLSPQKGQINILGKPIRDYDIKSLASLMGFVPQKSAINAPLLVRDFLLMGRYSGLGAFGDYGSGDRAEVESVARDLDIYEFLGRDVLSLSGGEFQRVLLGRALLKSPKILLLDEPTSALDMSYALELLRLCEGLLGRGIAIVAVLHDLHLAALFCTRLILLKDGAIYAQGSPKELFNPTILEAVYGLACKVVYDDGIPFVLPIKSLK